MGGALLFFQYPWKDGGNYPWMSDNLAKAPDAPKAGEITAKWTFGGAWDPERKSGPAIVSITVGEGKIQTGYGEAVTVKGHPRLVLPEGAFANYVSGSGSKA